MTWANFCEVIPVSSDGTRYAAALCHRDDDGHCGIGGWDGQEFTEGEDFGSGFLRGNRGRFPVSVDNFLRSGGPTITRFPSPS